MGLLDALSGMLSPMTPHPAVPHVLYRIKPERERLKLSMQCQVCGETLEWVCSHPQRAQWRVDTWAGWHRHVA